MIELAELLHDCTVASLPMRLRFRGITTRECVLINGRYGYGEFGAFPEYDDAEAAWWLASALESAYSLPQTGSIGVPVSVPVNATVPAVPAQRVPEILARFPGVTTAKVKVAEPGHTLAEDSARVNAVRELIPNVRVDANGKWTLAEAEKALNALGPLEYAEQPCATVAELAELRRRVATPIAADECIRRADDPFAVVAHEAADIAVLKVAPLGGITRTLDIAARLPIPVVISSALDSAVGINTGLLVAAQIDRLRRKGEPNYAHGLATSNFFRLDVATLPNIIDGRLSQLELTTKTLVPLASYRKRQWWLARIVRCYQLLCDGHPASRTLTDILS